MAVNESAFRRMKEADLRSIILVPLLGKMGYRDAFEWHGQGGELGKDVVAWKHDDLGNRRNIAVVAKANRISGVKAIAEVRTQVAQAFSSGFADQVTGERQRVHGCWIITNKRLGKEARDGIRTALPREHEPYVAILDGDDIWSRWKEHFPTNFPDAFAIAHEFLEQEDLGYRTRVWLEKGQRGIELGENYPGQLEAEPLEVSGEFRFPDTPEGRAKLEEWQQGLATGTPVRLPAEFVTMNLPESIRSLPGRLLGEEFGDTFSVEITSEPPETNVILSFEFESEDGDLATLPWVELRPVQVGTEEAKLTNERQELPILVTLVIHFDTPHFSVSIGAKGERMAAPHFHQFLDIKNKLGGPGRIMVTRLDPGLPFGSATHAGIEESKIDPLYLDGIRALADLQWLLKKPIYVPTGSINRKDWQTIGFFRAVLSQPNHSGRWCEATSQCRAADLQLVLSNFPAGEPRVYQHDEEVTVTLFGEELSLGEVRSICRDARLVNAAEAIRAAEQAAPDDMIDLRFAPGESDERRVQFMTLLEAMGGIYVNENDESPAVSSDEPAA